MIHSYVLLKIGYFVKCDFFFLTNCEMLLLKSNDFLNISCKKNVSNVFLIFIFVFHVNNTDSIN